jgi:uncharacterized protein (TIGR03435 family)
MRMTNAMAACAMLAAGLAGVAMIQNPAPPQNVGAAPLAFEVASVKPIHVPISTVGGCRGIDAQAAPQADPRRPLTPLGECVLFDVDLVDVISVAYSGELSTSGPPNQWIKGVPDWARSSRFQIQAKAENPSTTTSQQLRQMLQTLLAERFKLKLHRDSIEVAGFALVVAKSGPRLEKAKGEGRVRTYSRVPPSPALLSLFFQNASMKNLAGTLTTLGLGSVVDQTALQGAYDFTLTFEPQPGMTGKKPLPTSPEAGSGPSLFTAIEEQLGLKLTPQRVRVDHLVVDSAEKPSEN